jgi:hypothetical protein
MAVRILRESTFRPFRQVREAKKVPKYPPDHQPVMKVPKGGSMCLNCKFLGRDKKSCISPEYIDFMGTSKLPYPADQMCSDWWKPRG